MNPHDRLMIVLAEARQEWRAFAYVMQAQENCYIKRAGVAGIRARAGWFGTVFKSYVSFLLGRISGCGTARPSPEVQLTVSGCPKVSQCRLDRSAPRSNGDLNQVLDETEVAWAVCADKVDTIIACQERDSEQAAVLTQRPE